MYVYTPNVYIYIYIYIYIYTPRRKRHTLGVRRKSTHLESIVLELLLDVTPSKVWGCAAALTPEGTANRCGLWITPTHSDVSVRSCRIVRR